MSETPAGGPAYGQPGSPWYGKFGEPGTPPEPGAAPPPPPWEQRPMIRPQAAGGLPRALVATCAAVTVLTWVMVAFAPAAQEATSAADAGELTITGYDVAGMIAFPVQVAAWILTGLLLNRAQSNAQLVAPGSQRRSQVWAWIGWFVPVVQFWFPYQVVKDATQATVPEAERRGLRIGWWWAAWMVGNLIQAYALIIGFQAGFSAALEGDEAGASMPVEIVPELDLAAAVALTVALAFFVPIVLRLGRAQDALARGERP